MRLNFVLLCFLLLFLESTHALESPDIEALKTQANSGKIEAMWELGSRYWHGQNIEFSRKLAWEWWQMASKSGKPEDENEFGERLSYYQGFFPTFQEDKQAAVTFFQKAAEKGYAPAMVNLAKALQEGEGCTLDEKKSTEWLEKASKKGNSEAFFLLGEQCENEKITDSSLAKAFKLYTKASELGNREAKLKLAKMFLSGKGTKRDPKMAIPFLLEAAKEYGGEAKWELSCCYGHGIGVEKDDKEAVRWLKLAAEDGGEKAKFGLALRLFQGRGVPADLEKAFLILDSLTIDEMRIIEEGGREEVIQAKILLDKVKKKMTREQFEKAYKRKKEIDSEF